MGMESKRNAIKSYFLQMSKKTKVYPLERPIDHKDVTEPEGIDVQIAM